MPYPVTPPDGTTWTLDVETTNGGVALVLVFELSGKPTEVRLDMDLPESRRFARAVLAAGGDALERTFEGARLDASRR